MAVTKIDLDQKFTAEHGKIFLTGTQALVRLALVQARRDRQAGLNTGGFISGYRGSPLGGYDQQLALAKKHLDAHNIVFQPGVNEELAATAVWGTQQLHLSPGAKYDGVFGIWYGKGPGVDRCGDVFKHGNAAGTAKHGGILCLAGDDHAAKSSTVPHQSDHAFMAAIIPMLYPSSIHEFVEMGLLGLAMSRYSGCWVGMKVIADTVETTATVDLSGETRQIVLPTDFELPFGGLNLRWPDDRWSQDERLQNHKPFAALAFARANAFDRVTLDTPQARFGIVASGKAYEDVRQALIELEIDDALATKLGLRVYKVGMPWPLEPEGVRQFSLGLEEILIVEERREIIENQVKQQLFNWRADVRPRIVGKVDNEDKPVLSLNEELTPTSVARVIAHRLLKLDLPKELRNLIALKAVRFGEIMARQSYHQAPLKRTPFFCSGCPHNTSTTVPEGSRALAGIGCHFMVTWMDRNTETFTHMGGEGVPWTGIAPFTNEKHVFVNIGDGTYFHSGHLAIRQAVASGANVTYKVLYNDAVAMTGGQHVDGNLTPQRVAHQLYQEGVSPIYLLSERPDLYLSHELPPGTIVEHRDAIDAVMQTLREMSGCSAIIYEQTCAAEKRRRRKRGKLEDPNRRVVINAAVCEGCGDCSVQSNCVSVEPLETEFGRKRTVNQSTCNKDFSCVKGFCPSFVSVEGAKLRKRSPTLAIDVSGLPDPSIPALEKPYNIAITGVGGTGVLTIGAILGMAAHLEGKASIILDMAGLAQKGGAVLSHVRLAASADDIRTPRIVTGSADVLIAADNVVATSKESASLCSPYRTHGIVNAHLTPVADFVRNRDFDFQETEVEHTIRRYMRRDVPAAFYNFTSAAETLLGDAIATNIMMLGFAYQRGVIPLSAAALKNAIEMNGVGVAMNTRAFDLGRVLASAPERLKSALQPTNDAPKPQHEMSLDEIVEHRTVFLADYQDRALAKKYRALVRTVEKAVAPLSNSQDIARAVALNYAKLLAIKDEYEVARLYTDGDFERRLRAQFEDGYKLSFHLAPPFLPGEDANGRPKKRKLGPWIVPVFRLLAKFRHLRGTRWDVFGRTAERRVERQLIGEYETLVQEILASVTPANAAEALALVSLPADIRGYGPVKAQAIAKAKAREAELLARFRNPPSPTARPLSAAAE